MRPRGGFQEGAEGFGWKNWLRALGWKIFARRRSSAGFKSRSRVRDFLEGEDSDPDPDPDLQQRRVSDLDLHGLPLD